MWRVFLALFVLIAVPAVDLQEVELDEGGGTVTPQIVGGTPAGLLNFPYFVSIRTAGNQGFCGGFLINQRWVGTAAHCLTLRLDNGTTVVRSTANTKIAVGGNVLIRLLTRYNVLAFNIHPNYFTNLNTFDIACIQTEIPVVLVTIPIALVAPIEISVLEFGTNIPCRVIGAGATSTTSNATSQVLRYLDTTTITNAQCLAAYAGNPAASYVSSPNILCCSTPPNTGTCFGDSGGPLVNIALNRVIGVVKGIGGIGCANGNPDIYTRLSAFCPYIITTTGTGCV